MWENCFLRNSILEYGKRRETQVLILCVVTEPYNFKFFSFLLRGYHTLQFKNIAVPDITLSPHNFKILLTHQPEFFWASNRTYFFGDW